MAFNENKNQSDKQTHSNLFLKKSLSYFLYSNAKAILIRYGCCLWANKKFSFLIDTTFLVPVRFKNRKNV